MEGGIVSVFFNSQFSILNYLAVHTHQELVVILGLLQFVFHEVHSLYGCHVGQVLAQNPHTVQRLFVLQQVVAAGAGSRDVDGGVKEPFRVVSALALFLFFPFP